MSKPDQATGPLLREYHRGHLVAPAIPPAEAKDAAAARSGGWGAAGSARSLVSGTLSVLRAAFLPEGFPESVSPDYLSFQAWDTLQALSSYVRSMLTSQAILRGVGVGQQASTPLAAVFTFFVRDLAGMLGGILFAYLEGSSFDSCAKQWRLFADITNDLGMTMELASPLFPRAMFLPVACLGSIARSVTGVAGGATRAALTTHFARQGNAADVSAKEQSQETATTIIGMVAGMAVTRLLAAGGDPGEGSQLSDSASASAARAALAAWLVFASLTVVHVWANVRAMRVLVLASINQPRLELLVDSYLRNGSLLTPAEVSEREDLTPPPFRRLIDLASGAMWRRAARLHYGSRLTTLLPPPGQGRAGEQQQAASLEQLLVRQGRRRYLLLTTAPASASASDRTSASSSSSPSPSGPPPSPHHVHLVLHCAATTTDQLRGFVHSHCLARQLAARQQQGQGGLQGGRQLAARKQQGQGGMQGGRQKEEAAGGRDGAAAAGGALDSAAAERAADDWMAARYDTFVSELRAAGWHTDRVAIPRPAWTAEWGLGGAGAAGGAGAGRLHTD